ncbi:MAG: ABC transporter permease subunit [Firmicutes bacterium]|nr:ABC transporter permease subunit [Bacillota bacterium]
MTSTQTGWGWREVGLGVFLAVLLALVIRLATRVHGFHPESGAISLSLAALPEDALWSWLRMAAAYALSLAFSLVYAYEAAHNAKAEKILIPILDILQSIPVLSFLPVVLLAFIGLFPHSRLGVNLASILLIFTGQVWNMVFSLYHGMITVPQDLQEAADNFQMNRWQRFRLLELPHSMVGLVWNSMMSWAGGWFFLMACEMFALGSRQFRLQGLGSYLQTAANKGQWGAELAGLGMLVLVIVAMDQLIWRPLLAWAEKFKVELIEAPPSHSAVLVFWRRLRLVHWLGTAWAHGLEAVDRSVAAAGRAWRRTRGLGIWDVVRWLFTAAMVIALYHAIQEAVRLVAGLPRGDLAMVGWATLATLGRVLAALAISVIWTVPVGVWIGLDRRWAGRLTPFTQIAASVPATALFPGLVALLLHVSGGLSLAAVILMVLGTQWYILFNVIAGASAIPEDLKEAARLFRLGRRRTWTLLILPAISPYLTTGLITAAGGAWNASIVAEYVSFQGHVYTTFGVGALIAESSVNNNDGLLLLSTVTLALTVVVINRFVWRRLYRRAEQRYRLG